MIVHHCCNQAAANCCHLNCAAWQLLTQTAFVLETSDPAACDELGLNAWHYLRCIISSLPVLRSGADRCQQWYGASGNIHSFIHWLLCSSNMQFGLSCNDRNKLFAASTVIDWPSSSSTIQADKGRWWTQQRARSPHAHHHQCRKARWLTQPRTSTVTLATADFTMGNLPMTVVLLSTVIVGTALFMYHITSLLQWQGHV